MARKTVETISDDLDGSANASAVSFSYDGVEYSIDLSKKNKTALDKLLKPYLEAGTRVGGRRSGARRSSGPSSKRSDLNDVRAWATAQGMKVSDRGRVSADILAAFDGR